jgi:ADYC domain
VSSVSLKLGVAALLLAATPATLCAQTRLTVHGTEFVVTTPDGRSLRSADLIGATLKFRAHGQPLDVTIQGVETDRYAVGGRVVLHRFVAKDDSGKLVDLCTPDAGGRSLGFPVPDGRGGFDLTCTSGVVGKCIRWGYRYWEEQPGGPPLRALHRACVHMARADYGGDGSPSTRDGTLIDIHDHFGIQRFDRAVPMAFEAAWGVDGAICVARPRIAENVSLAQLAERYPHLAPRLGPGSCTEDGAMRDPAALLFNRSRQ